MGFVNGEITVFYGLFMGFVWENHPEMKVSMGKNRGKSSIYPLNPYGGFSRKPCLITRGYNKKMPFFFALEKCGLLTEDPWFSPRSKIGEALHQRSFGLCGSQSSPCFPWVRSRSKKNSWWMFLPQFFGE